MLGVSPIGRPDRLGGHLRFGCKEIKAARSPLPIPCAPIFYRDNEGAGLPLHADRIIVGARSGSAPLRLGSPDSSTDSDQWCTVVLRFGIKVAGTYGETGTNALKCGSVSLYLEIILRRSPSQLVSLTEEWGSPPRNPPAMFSRLPSTLTN